MQTSRRAGSRLIGWLAFLLISGLTVASWLLFFPDRIYPVAVLLITYTAIPLLWRFERRKLPAGELVLIAVMAAVAVAGRAALFFAPQVKPVCAIIVIAGACLGAEAGSMCGVLTAFLSNFFYGQGIWTPFQMLALGLCGALSGMLFFHWRLPKSPVALTVFGTFAAMLIYGPITDASSALFLGGALTREGLIAIFVAGIPFNIIHGISTAFFLLLIAKPFVWRIERVRQKYGVFPE